MDPPPESAEPESNYDVSGTAVAVANIIVSLCSRILVTWSPADVNAGFKASLTQFYPVILSMLMVINRNQLSLYDAACALNLTSPPLTVYLTISSIRDLFQVRTSLYKMFRSDPYHYTIRVLGALMLPLWFGVAITLCHSTRAFSDSSDDTTQPGWSWLWPLFYSYFLLPVPNKVGRWIFIPIVVSFFLLCLFRRRFQVMTEFRDYQEGASKSWKRWCVPWTFVKCAWGTVDRHHKWCIYSLFAYLDCCWTLVTAYFARGAPGKYVLSYGQLLSLFAAIPPLIPTAKLFYTKRWSIYHFFRHLPMLFFAEVRYLATGTELDPPVQGSYLPLTSPHQPSTKYTTI